MAASFDQIANRWLVKKGGSVAHKWAGTTATPGRVLAKSACGVVENMEWLREKQKPRCRRCVIISRGDIEGI